MATSEDDEIIPLPRVAERFNVARRTIEDRAWRQRAGLPAIKLGGRIVGVRAGDLRRALRRERFA